MPVKVLIFSTLFVKQRQPDNGKVVLIISLQELFQENWFHWWVKFVCNLIYQKELDVIVWTITHRFLCSNSQCIHIPCKRKQTTRYTVISPKKKEKKKKKQKKKKIKKKKNKKKQEKKKKKEKKRKKKEKKRKKKMGIPGRPPRGIPGNSKGSGWLKIIEKIWKHKTN